jgi:hypothetical protein
LGPKQKWRRSLTNVRCRSISDTGAIWLIGIGARHHLDSPYRAMSNDALGSPALRLNVVAIPAPCICVRGDRPGSRLAVGVVLRGRSFSVLHPGTGAIWLIGIAAQPTRSRSPILVAAPDHPRTLAQEDALVWVLRDRGIEGGNSDGEVGEPTEHFDKLAAIVKDIEAVAQALNVRRGRVGLVHDANAWALHDGV